MEFVLMSIKIIGTLIVLILLMLLLLKFNESKLNEVNSRKTIRVIERTQLSKDVSLQIIKIGKKAYVMSVSPSKGEFIKELTEEELNEIEVLKKFEIEKNKEAFNNIIKPFEEVINMKNKKAYKLIVFFIIAITFMIPKEAFASPHFNLSVSSGDTPADYVDSIKILIFFTMLTLLPSFIIMFTSFTRITVVFSLLKNAIGAQQSIPSQILVGLAIFLTILIMQPVYTEINEVALKPYSNEEITFEQALENASNPIKDFMLKETRQKDLELFVDAAKLNSGELTRKNIPLYLFKYENINFIFYFLSCFFKSLLL